MRVGAADLTLWSFLMASAHGAGLMALPFALAAEAHASHIGHVAHGGGLLPTLAHTAGYLVVLTVSAVVVYERVGLRMLRTAWINLDLVWSAALACTAVLTVVV